MNTMPGFNAHHSLGKKSGKDRRPSSKPTRGRDTPGVYPASVSCHVEFFDPSAGASNPSCGCPPGGCTCYAYEWWGGTCGCLTDCTFSVG
jgi:hypothetical protein